MVDHKHSGSGFSSQEPTKPGQGNQILALIQQGRLEEAEAACKSLIAADTDKHAAYFNLGAIRGIQNNNDEMIDWLLQAVGLNAHHPESHYMLGIGYEEQGDLNNAAASYSRAVAIRADYTEAYHKLALILAQKGDISAAITTFKKALDLSPGDADIHNNLGNALQKNGDYLAASDCYNTAISLNPEFVEAHFNLGLAEQKRGNPAKAITHYQQTISLKADHLEAHVNLGLIRRTQGELDAAINIYRKGLAIKPDHADTLNNLGIALHERGEIDAAVECFNKALAIKPDHAGAHQNKASALHELGEIAAAISSYDAALAISPGDADALWNRASTLLLQGEYADGWRGYEQRSQRDVNPIRPHATPRCSRWDGGPLETGQQLLLVSEQGFGDTLQFMRYVIPLRQQGVDVRLCVQPKLQGLVQASGLDPAPLTPEHANQVSSGLWAPLLSVPGYLNVSPDNPLVTEPYIQATAELNAKWRNLLAQEQRPIIGINWQGNPRTEQRELRGRSLSLEAFAPIAACGQGSLLSLQKGHGSEQLARCSFRDRFVACQDQLETIWDFLETAAIIHNCDLVITSDTAVAHLAAGMGKPTWLLLQHVPEWRWGLHGDTSFWYPTMRLFRQPERGNWEAVMTDVAKALQQQNNDSNNNNNNNTSEQLLAPVSLGELIDKITILQIKAQHLHGTALQNVRKELAALQRSFQQLNLSIDPALITQLKQVNQELWRIEDAIRDQERQQDFGPAFIALARSVYQQNDRRAAIKKEINTRCGSAYVEEKSYHDYTTTTEQQLQQDITTASTPTWRTIAITLDPDGPRFRDCLANNSHLAITPMTAIRGEDISRDDGIRLGLASQDLYDSGLLTPGALGCAASHRTLWQQCQRDNTPLLVLEDDCTTHPDIASFIQDNLQTLLDSDVCFLGLNTDSIVQSISPQGVMRVSVFDPQHPSQAWIKATLKQTEARTVALHRLVKGFGLWAYVVSPQGARKLLDGALPLSLATTNVPLLSEAMPAISLDRAACGVYGQLNALVCQPFLAYAPNEGGAVA